MGVLLEMQSLECTRVSLIYYLTQYNVISNLDSPRYQPITRRQNFRLVELKLIADDILKCIYNGK